MNGARQIRWAAKAVLVLLLGWVLLCALVWALAPALVRSQLERVLGEQLGRAVHVESVSLRPWSLELELHGLRIDAATEGAPALLTVDRIYADAAIASLWHLAPVVDALQVQGIRAHLSHQGQLGQGHYDIDDILERLAKQPASDPVHYALYNIDVRDGQVDFSDTLPSGQTVEHHLRALSLQLPFVSNLPAKRDVAIRPHLAMELNGALWDSDASAKPFADDPAGSVRLRVQHWDLSPYLAYWPAQWPQRLSRARLDMALELEFVNDDQQPHVLLRQLQLHADELALQDSSVSTRRGVAPEFRLSDVQLDLAQWRWPALAEPGQSGQLGSGTQGSGKLGLQIGTDFAPGQAQLDCRLEGSVSQGRAQCELSQAALAWASPWLAPLWAEGSPMELQGQLSAQLTADWQGNAVTLNLPSVRADKLQLSPVSPAQKASDKAAWPAVRSVQLQDVAVSLAQRSVQVRKLLVDQAVIPLVRNQSGQINVLQWLRTPQTHASAPAPSPTPSSVDSGWSVALDTLDVHNAQLSWMDYQTSTPVLLALAHTQVQVSHLHWNSAGADTRAAGQQKLALQLQTDVSGLASQADAGHLSVSGSVSADAALLPQAAQLQIQAQDLPLQVLSPYLADKLAVEVRRLDSSFAGQVEWVAASQAVSVNGDASLEDLHLRTQSDEDAEDLLRWKSLQVAGLQVRMRPQEALRVSAREASLNDFYARIILQSNGDLNLQHLLKPAPASAPGGATTATSTTTAASPDPVVEMGPIRLVQGRVDFDDFYIQPHYALRVSELNGRLGAFSSVRSTDGTVAMADLTLHGRAEGTASLDVTGRLNPLAKPLAADVQARLRDLELSPLSPYAAKYAGYGIERGKMNMDLHYTVAPDGQLQATNKLVLKQLRFGEQPLSAKTLPVKLAVALLADADGVIDVDLPISGSVNDPQFSIGPVIWKAIGNLIVKAATSPFRLLASLGHQADNVSLDSSIAFAAGSAELSDAARQTLQQLAKGLAAKPALHLSIKGQADAAAELQAMQSAKLDTLLMAEKRRRLAAAGSSDEVSEPLTPQEKVDLLRSVYKRADIPRKPRNAAGVATDIPPEQMRALLMPTLTVSQDAVRELALQRAVAVKEYLISQQLGAERLYLSAVQLQAEGDVAVQPRALLDVGVD